MFDNVKLIKNMEKLKNGDTSAFDYIYEQTYRMVYYIIYQIVKRRDIAEEVMQNVYINVFEKIYQYKDNNSPKAWIAMIARNLAINEYNKLKKEIIVDIDTMDFIDNKNNDEETPLIDLAQENLDKDEFLIVMLCVCEGYKRREVAEILGLSTSGVTWKLNQALNKLKCLTKGGVLNEYK